MSRQRMLIRNILKWCPKAWLPLLAVGMSASVFSNQLPEGAQISQQSSTVLVLVLVLGAGGDAERAAHNVMPAQLSAQRLVVDMVKAAPLAPDQIDPFKRSLNPSETISRYLWESSKPPEQKLSRNLREGSKAPELKLSRYLWDGAKTSEIQPLRVLWRDEKASELQSASRPWAPMPVSAEQG